jgi:hypothetical protein
LLQDGTMVELLEEFEDIYSHRSELELNTVIWTNVVSAAKRFEAFVVIFMVYESLSYLRNPNRALWQGIRISFAQGESVKPRN